MVIQHNIMAMNAYRNYTNNSSALASNLEKLSSGYKINRAGDDAAGLAISEKMRAQISGLDAAAKNVKDGISLVKTAEGAMQEVQDMLNRMVTLATQSANGTYQDEVDREALQAEIDQLNAEIDRIADSANFNGIKLLDGSLDAEGVATSVKGSERIIQTQASATNTAADVGTVTFLDGAEPTTAKGTVFEMDFADLKIAASSDDSTGGEFTQAGTLPTGVKSVSGTPTTATDADVNIKVETAVATGAEADGAAGGPLAGFTINAGDDNAAAGNVAITFKSGSSDSATYDAENGTLEITLDSSGGTGSNGKYDATDLQAAIRGLGQVTSSGNDTQSKIDLSKFTITDDGSDPELDASTTITGGTITLSGGAAGGDKVITLSGGVTGTATVTAADWDGTGDNEVTISGLKITIDGTASLAGLDGSTNAKIGTATAPAGGAGGAAATPTVDVKLGGTDIATNVAVAVDDEAKDIAEKVFAEIVKTSGTKETDSKYTAVDLFGDGTLYTAEVSNGKIKFTLESDPTADNIQGNFDWDIKATNASLQGNHTAGTNVVTPGSVADSGVRANTVFGITTADLVDGTKITIDDETVTLSIGPNSTIKEGNGVVKLTTAEAADINLALGKISQGFGGSSTNFDISVNDGSNKDAKTGLAVYKKADSEKSYTTVDELATVFSMSVASSGGKGKALTLQIGDTSDSFNQLKVSIGDIHADALGVGSIDIGNQAGASEAIDVIKAAINRVSSIRGTLGATQNRLEHTSNNLSVMAENIQDAESTIRDTDVAEEMMSYVKNNILVQSAQAMLAQANQVPQGVLQLLG